MIVNTTSAYLPLSIEKHAIQACRAQEKQMRIMQAHVRAIQPYLNALRAIRLSEIQSRIQHILPALNFLRFAEETEALNRAQRQIRFYREILSNANYRKEEIFSSQVENSPPRNFSVKQGISKREVVKTNFISREDFSENPKKEPSVGQYLKSFLYVIPQSLRVIIFPKGFFEIRAKLEQEGFSKRWVNLISFLQFMFWRFTPFAILFWQLEWLFQIFKEFSPLIKLIKFLLI